MHSFDSAVGMSPEACSKRVHSFTVAAHDTLSQDKMDTTLHGKELDSYLFTFCDAQKASKILSLFQNAFNFLRCFSKKRGSAQREGQGAARLG